MIIHFSVNGLPGNLALPAAFIEQRWANELAELVASDYWRHRPTEQPSTVTLVHLQNVDGADLGQFEVRREMHPVFTATPL
ncbi:hypothetical protein D9M70_600630 [compost metagenome]